MNVNEILSAAKADLRRQVEITTYVRDEKGKRVADGHGNFKTQTRKSRVWTPGPPNQGRYGIGLALVSAGGWTDETVDAFNKLRQHVGCGNLGNWEHSRSFEDVIAAIDGAQSDE